MNIILGLIALFIILAVYFLPSIIASHKKHRNAEAISILNLLLGWTILGWIIALVWALMKEKKENKNV